MNEIRIGDCRETMRTMIAAGVKVQMCVTSPPYWGLRDYGVDGQLGLERTPQEYVANMVEVFRLVRELLEDDGTLWLNLGSSYASGDTTPNRSLGGALAYGSDGTALLDSEGAGRACPCCDGGHRDASLIHHARTAHSSHGSEQSAQRPSLKDRDTSRLRSASASLDALPLDALASTSPALSENDRDVSGREATASVYRAWLDSFASCVLPSVCNSCLNHTIFSQYTFKPKDMISTPWMVAMALQADGWFLRSDIIWSKPNPMPESVRDRCTKSHEYLFMLAKNEHYYYDALTIRESATDTGRENGRDGRDEPQAARPPGSSPRTLARLDYTKPRKVKIPGGWVEIPGGRNKRSVWTVATQPYSEAHFATYPPALIEPCILAGSRARDVVFDPFMGSGTTAMVALQLGRRYLGCELNPEYAKLAEQRAKVTYGF